MADFEDGRLPEGRDRWPIGGSTTAAAALVAGLAVIAFLTSLSGAFVSDDVFEIAGNRLLERLWPIWDPLTAGNRLPARFLPYLSFAIDRRIWGASPRGFHLTNLIVHVCAAVALFHLVRITLCSPRLGGRFARQAGPLALAVAGLWAVHPLHTQAVTYVYQRIESLCGLFSLLAVGAFARAAATGWPRPQLALCVAATAAAMASKEHAVVLPLVILAYDWCFVAERPGDILGRRRFYAALAATWLVLALQLAVEAGRYSEFQETPHPPLAYLLTQPGVILHYLRLAFWPVGLCFDYDWPLARSARDVLVPGALMLAALAITVGGMWRRQPWAWPAAAFFLALAPTSSIMPTAAVVAEHRMYLPLAAVIAAAVVGGFAAVRAAIGAHHDENTGGRAVWPWAFGAAVALAIMLLAAATWRRNEVYCSREDLWQDVLARYPENARGHSQVATEAALRGDLATAEAHARSALRSRPGSPVFRDIAAGLARRGNAAAAERFLRAGVERVEASPAASPHDRLTARAALAGLLREQGRDPEAAALCEPLLEDCADQLGPADPWTIAARTTMAHALIARGDLPAAERLSQETLATAMRSPGAADPITQSAAAPLAAVLADTGRAADGEQMLRELIAKARAGSYLREPDLAVAGRLLAGLLERSMAAEPLGEALEWREAVVAALERRAEADPRESARAEVARENTRARLAEALGQFDAAGRVALGAVSLAIDRLGHADPLTQRAGVALSACYYRTDRADKAEAVLREYLAAAAVEREAAPVPPPPPTIVQGALAGLLEQAGRLDEATLLRRDLLRDALDRLGPNHPATQQAAVILKAVLAAKAERKEKATAASDP